MAKIQTYDKEKILISRVRQQTFPIPIAIWKNIHPT